MHNALFFNFNSRGEEVAEFYGAENLELIGSILVMAGIIIILCITLAIYKDELQEIVKKIFIMGNNEIDKIKALPASAPDVIEIPEGNSPETEKAETQDAPVAQEETPGTQAVQTEPQPVLKIGTFNVPKKEEAGEDADPVCDILNDCSWGALGVFDGMGGAGAKKYRNENGEEHTAAYWASRIVQKLVSELIQEAGNEPEPVKYLETNLHEAIKKRLDEEKAKFPSVESKVQSKMIAVLPTTMALGIYETAGETIRINSYWAGDSRIYLMDADRTCYLTLDDADAPDRDPFSPQNMDLPMNNEIRQDQDFRISKSVFNVKAGKPAILFAATDGCFGYFRNPIEFDRMMLESMMKSESPEEWLANIRKAIIDNEQQDDFSMALTVLGCSNFGTLKSYFSKRFEYDIYKDYGKFIADYTARKKEYADEISASAGKLDKKVSLDMLDFNDKFDALIENVKKYKQLEDGKIEKIKKELQPEDYTEIQSLRKKIEMAKRQSEENELEYLSKNNDYYNKYKKQYICTDAIKPESISKI